MLRNVLVGPSVFEALSYVKMFVTSCRRSRQRAAWRVSEADRHIFKVHVHVHLTTKE